MYRTCGAQHGYDVFDIGTTKGTILQVMYRNFVAQHGYEPIGLEHRASEIFDFVSMLKTRSV